jgi:hypothetical protein
MLTRGAEAAAGRAVSGDFIALERWERFLN